MIKDDHQLGVTLDALAGMYKSLAALVIKKNDYWPIWFEILASGDLEMIRRLEAEINEYLQKQPWARPNVSP